MKKKISLEIKSPCNANVNDMTKISAGFHCGSCAKNVFDLSNKSNYEIEKFISENRNKNICARLRNSQLTEKFNLIETPRNNNLKFAVAIAASVLLTTNLSAQEKIEQKTEQTEPVKNNFMLGKIAYREVKKETTTIVISGKLLDSVTKQPLSKKEFPFINFSIPGLKKPVNVNAKTGVFKFTITLDKNTKKLNLVINSGNKELRKTISIRINSNQEVIFQNILVDPKMFDELIIMGEMGILYKDNNKNIPS